MAEDLIEHVQECQEEAKSPAFALEPVFQGVVMTYLTANGARSFLYFDPKRLPI